MFFIHHLNFGCIKLGDAHCKAEVQLLDKGVSAVIK